VARWNSPVAVSTGGRRPQCVSARCRWHNILSMAQQGRQGNPMKTVMGWIDKIVSSLARRKVNKNEGRPNTR